MSAPRFISIEFLHHPFFPQYNYIQDYYGFQDEDITVLVDDGDHRPPTRANILAAYETVVRQSQAGDAIFLHYSGHGTKLPDDNGDEDDGYDEALVPLDFKQAGMIRDDLLYDIIVKGLPPGVHVVALVSLHWLGAKCYYCSALKCGFQIMILY